MEAPPKWEKWIEMGPEGFRTTLFSLHSKSVDGKGAFAIAKAGFFFGRVFLCIKKKVGPEGFITAFSFRKRKPRGKEKSVRRR